MLDANRREFLRALLGGAAGMSLTWRSDGLLMIDGGLANRAGDLAQAVAAMDPRRVRVLFNTHDHGDHVGSNVMLGKSGVRIIAHENAKKRLGERIESEAFGLAFGPVAGNVATARTALCGADT